MYYIYILYSESSDLFYVGNSENPWKRLKQHNTNSTEKFTGRHSSWVLKSVFEVSEKRGDAHKIEKFIKNQKSRSLILKLIDPEFKPSGILSKMVRVPHLRD